MHRIEVTDARKAFADTINRVFYSRERIVLDRRGKPVAAIVSMDDLKLLEAIEDRMDLEDALDAMNEPGSQPWEKVKKDLGL